MEAIPVNGEFAYASWGRRILSSLVDNFVISVLAVPFAGPAMGRVLDALSEDAALPAGDLRTVTLVNLLTTVGYLTALHAWRGATLGKMLLRTVLVRDDGSRVTASTAFVRSVTIVAIQFVSAWLFIPLLIDELWPLWNRRKQTLHDIVAKTIVVRSASAQAVAATES